MQGVIRQGDIYFAPIDTVPEGKKMAHDGTFVVAEGEKTGHKHVLRGGLPSAFDVFQADDEPDPLFMFHEKVTLTHDEHSPLTIPKGAYRIVHERELDHFANSIRRVAD